MTRDLASLVSRLCKGEFSSFLLRYNDHAASYQTVAYALADRPDWYHDDDFVPGEREKCIATNTMWSAQWYPKTPVGFCILYASTLEALYAALEEVASEGDA
jgi:hypothetical protein